VEAARRHATAAGLLEGIVEGMQVKVSALLLEKEEAQEAAATAEAYIVDLKVRRKGREGGREGRRGRLP